MKTIYDSKLKKAVYEELTADYDKHTAHQAFDKFSTFKEFWDDVDVTNAYEEEWKEWKRKGIKNLYKEIYNENKSRKK